MYLSKNTIRRILSILNPTKGKILSDYRSTDDQRGHEQRSRRDKSGRDQGVR